MCIYRSQSCSFCSVHREASFRSVPFNARNSGVNSMVIYICVYIYIYIHTYAYMFFLLKRLQRQTVGLMETRSIDSGAVGELFD